MSYDTIGEDMSFVTDTLKEAAETFEEKSKVYGEGYKEFGVIMHSLFPDGLELKTAEDFNRFGVPNMIVSKMARYCKNFQTGGHKDSLLDLSVYSCMLIELDKIKK